VCSADGGILWSKHALRPPVPSPVDLRLRFFDDEPGGFAIPPREGERRTLDRNRVVLVKVLPWKYAFWKLVGDALPLVRLRGGDTGQPPGAESFSTAVFYCLRPESLEVEAVLHSGETARLDRGEKFRGWLSGVFDAGIDEIREYRIREEPGVREIVFHLPKIRGLPPENEGVTNRLDIQFPPVLLDRSSGYGRGGSPMGYQSQWFMSEALGLRFLQDHRHSNSTRRIVADSEHRGIAVRDALDYFFPNRWWVSEGRVRTTRECFGPIVWKVKEAVRELREK